MRPLSIAILIVLVCSVLTAQTKVITTLSDESVFITRKRVVLVRTGRVVKQFPEKRRAVVVYPVISGLRDPAVLQKVRALLTVKNIFDSSLAEYRRDTWLEEFNYKVNHNWDGILDITFTQMGSAAYPDSQSKHLAIDLKTGNLLKATDSFHANKLDELASLVDKKLQAEVAELIVEAKRDPHQDQDGKQNIIDALEQQKFKLEHLDDYSVGAKGITFLYDAGFPHVIQALQPVGEYFVVYSELKSFIKSDGPLGQFVR